MRMDLFAYKDVTTTIMEMKKKRYILFGSGYFGKAAVVLLGKDNISYFVDNDERKWGSKVFGITVISPHE